MNKEFRKIIITLTRLKKDFYNNLSARRITNNRKFWQTILPNFTDKTLKDEWITLVDGDKVKTEEKDVVKKKVQESFSEKCRDSEKLTFHLNDDPILNAIEDFSEYASAPKIK